MLSTTGGWGSPIDRATTCGAIASEVLVATADLEDEEVGGDETTATAAELLRTKHARLVTTNPAATVAQAIAVMNQHDVRAVPVVSDSLEIVGVLSQRDIVQALERSGADTLEMLVLELMSVDSVSCEIDDTIGTVIRTMGHRRIRHVPVVANGRPIGMVGVNDVLRHLLERERKHQPVPTSPDDSEAWTLAGPHDIGELVDRDPRWPTEHQSRQEAARQRAPCWDLAPAVVQHIDRSQHPEQHVSLPVGG